MLFDIILCYLVSFGVIWCHLVFGVVWCYFVLIVVIWCHLVSFCVI